MSNGLTIRPDSSILYSRIGIIIVFYTIISAITSLHITYLQKGIGLYGGLFNVTSITHTFQIFILLISGIILMLTGFYPRKKFKGDSSSFIETLISKRKKYIKIINKMSEQFTIIEYTLIIVFVIAGATLLLTSGDFASIYLCIELQSFSRAPCEAYVVEVLIKLISILSGIFGLFVTRRYLPRVITGITAKNYIFGIADYRRTSQRGLTLLEISLSGDSHGQVNEFDTYRMAQLSLNVLSRITRHLKGKKNVSISRLNNVNCQNPFVHFSKEDIHAQSPKTILSTNNILQPRDLTAYEYNIYLMRGRSFHSSLNTKENSQNLPLSTNQVSSIKGDEDLNHKGSESTTPIST